MAQTVERGLSVALGWMDPTLTGSELMIRQIDKTEEGATTLVERSKKDGGITMGHTTAAYP